MLDQMFINSKCIILFCVLILLFIFYVDNQLHTSTSSKLFMKRHNIEIDIGMRRTKQAYCGHSLCTCNNTRDYCIISHD